VFQNKPSTHTHELYYPSCPPPSRRSRHRNSYSIDFFSQTPSLSYLPPTLVDLLHTPRPIWSHHILFYQPAIRCPIMYTFRDFEILQIPRPSTNFHFSFASNKISSFALIGASQRSLLSVRSQRIPFKSFKGVFRLWTAQLVSSFGVGE
jgi:hypothetical protein